MALNKMIMQLNPAGAAMVTKLRNGSFHWIRIHATGAERWGWAWIPVARILIGELAEANPQCGSGPLTAYALHESPPNIGPRSGSTIMIQVGNLRIESARDGKNEVRCPT